MFPLLISSSSESFLVFYVVIKPKRYSLDQGTNSRPRYSEQTGIPLSYPGTPRTILFHTCPVKLTEWANIVPCHLLLRCSMVELLLLSERYKFGFSLRTHLDRSKLRCFSNCQNFRFFCSNLKLL